MSEQNQKKQRSISISIDRLVDDYQQHPSMRQVEVLKEQLKQEKLEDKNFYQSIKKKIATR